MAQKTLDVRIIIRHDTEARWSNNPDFIPLSGEVIIYDKDEHNSYERFKVGDGKTPISQLPFAVYDLVKEVIQTTVIPDPNPDWNQEDDTAKDFIKNKPDVLTKEGGVIEGSLTITGDLAVNGTTISEDHQTLLVEDNMAVLNSNKVNLQTALSGIAINKNDNSTYGAVYDPTDDTFKFGAGTVDENNDFHFSANEGLPFAVRDDSSKFTNNHTVMWSSEGNKLVDSGYDANLQSDWNETRTSHPSFIRNKPNTLTSVEWAIGKRVSGTSADGVTVYGEIFNDYDTNTITGSYGHAEGRSTSAGEQAHAEGASSRATAVRSHAEGYSTDALGPNSHVEGVDTFTSSEAYAGHAEGQRSQAMLSSAHAEGYLTYASGWYAHAEGQETVARGNHSHAGGYETISMNENTHSEGYITVASGVQAHAEGQGRTVIRKVTGTADSTTYTIDDITDLAKGAVVKYKCANPEMPDRILITVATITAIDEVTNQITVSTTLASSSVLGSAANLSNAEVTVYLRGIASGPQAHVEGYCCNAINSCDHAEGYMTTASGGYSHSEGQATLARNWESHAEGKLTIASGVQSHAGGFGSEASGRRSFAHGYLVNATKEDQFVIGRCNNPNDEALFIVGNGINAGTEDTPNITSSNAFEVVSTSEEVAIKVGNTTITESQFNSLLSLLQ